jgi:hypothetical protein
LGKAPHRSETQTIRAGYQILVEIADTAIRERRPVGRDPDVLASDAAVTEEEFEAGSNNRFIAGRTCAVDVDGAKIDFFDAVSDRSKRESLWKARNLSTPICAKSTIRSR